MRQALIWTIDDPVNSLIYVSQAVNVLNDMGKDIKYLYGPSRYPSMKWNANAHLCFQICCLYVLWEWVIGYAHVQGNWRTFCFGPNVLRYLESVEQRQVKLKGKQITKSRKYLFDLETKTLMPHERQIVFNHYRLMAQQLVQATNI